MNDNPIHEAQVKRLSAFPNDGKGGNPAGVWIGDELPDHYSMQRIAADVGYSETIFLAPRTGSTRKVRYFSPAAEVAFCGHASIAAGVALGKKSKEEVFFFETTVGVVPVSVKNDGGHTRATLTSVETRHEPVTNQLLIETLNILDWALESLDLSIPPAKAYAGAWHLILAVSNRDQLRRLAYDFESLKALMLREGLTTLQLIWRQDLSTFHSRNPFPVGGVVEDPATGAAAAALGGYLRDAGLITTPVNLTVFQGEDMGLPSKITVDIPNSGGIQVSGTAIDL